MEVPSLYSTCTAWVLVLSNNFLEAIVPIMHVRLYIALYMYSDLPASTYSYPLKSKLSGKVDFVYMLGYTFYIAIYIVATCYSMPCSR